MMLPKLRDLEGRKILIGDNLFSHLGDAVIKAWSQSNTAFVCLCPNATHVLQPLEVAWFVLEVAWFVPLKKYGEKLSRIGKDHPTDLDTKVPFRKSISRSY